MQVSSLNKFGPTCLFLIIILTLINQVADDRTSFQSWNGPKVFGLELFPSLEFRARTSLSFLIQVVDPCQTLSSLMGFTLFGSFCLYIYVFRSFLGSLALKKAWPGNQKLGPGSWFMYCGPKFKPGPSSSSLSPFQLYQFQTIAGIDLGS